MLERILEKSKQKVDSKSRKRKISEILPEKTEKVTLNLIRVIPLPWVELSAIGQLFCADRQGPHLVLAFFTEKQGLDTYSSKIVTLDMATTSSLHSMLFFPLIQEF
jgi:hypothetical protein